MKEVGAGVKSKACCGRHWVAAAICQYRTATYAGMTLSEVRRLKELEAENSTRTMLMAEAEPGGTEGPSGPKTVNPQSKREAVKILMTEQDSGVTRACGSV